MSWIPSGPILLVSPHLDDAVLSCEALVGRLEPIHILTVFAGEPDPPRRGWWDETCGFESSAVSIPARRLEDDAALAGMPHRRLYLELLELQYADRRTSEEETVLGRAIGDWLARFPSATVAVPAGAGRRERQFARLLTRFGHTSPEWVQHPDHVFVRDAALTALAASNGVPLLCEELPYLVGMPADGVVERAARRHGCTAEPIVVEIDRERKATRIAAYATQIPHISPEHGRLDDPRTLPPRERYWRLVSSS